MTSPNALGDRLYQYGLLMRLDRPIGALLLLWPTLWALWIAGEGRPDPGVTIIFILGVFVMRSAGCVINDYADRDFDGHVARTRERPLASGRVSSREALTLFTVLVLIALGLVSLLNGLTILLSGIAIALAASYPFMKRYTYLPQVHLGLAFGWGVPMSFAALEQGLPPVAWLILVAVVLWAIVYDTMYAMVDRDDDIRIGVKSTAILFGPADKLVIGVTQIVFLLVLLLIGENAGLGVYYTLGLMVAAILSGYQQYLLRGRDPALCFKAFLNNNWLGAAVFTGIVAHYALGST